MMDADLIITNLGVALAFGQALLLPKNHAHHMNKDKSLRPAGSMQYSFVVHFLFAHSLNVSTFLVQISLFSSPVCPTALDGFRPIRDKVQVVSELRCQVFSLNKVSVEFLREMRSPKRLLIRLYVPRLN